MRLKISALFAVYVLVVEDAVCTRAKLPCDAPSCAVMARTLRVFKADAPDK